jgi:hypothetical protein
MTRHRIRRGAHRNRSAISAMMPRPEKCAARFQQGPPRQTQDQHKAPTLNRDRRPPQESHYPRSLRRTSPAGANGSRRAGSIKARCILPPAEAKPESTNAWRRTRIRYSQRHAAVTRMARAMSRGCRHNLAISVGYESRVRSMEYLRAAIGASFACGRRWA